MTLEQRVYEPEMLDTMTEDMPREFTVEPGNYFPLNQTEAIANYTEEPIKVSLKIHMGRTLIGVHP